MKTYTKISSLAVVCALCAGASMPASAAPSVRSLGGAGTYSSASSATQAKSGTTSSVQKADTVRGGSLAVGDTGATTTTAKKATTTSNVNSGVRGSSVRSASVRVPSTARLSIGKYLGGSTVSRPSLPEKEPAPGVSEDFVEYDIQYNDKTKVLTINERQEDGSYVEVMERDVASHNELLDLQNLVGSGELDTSASTIIAAINELVAGKQDKLTAGDGIAIDGDMISARVGNGLAIENGVIVTDIEFPDAPIQKKIEAGDGIEVEPGTDSDTVKVKLAADGGLEFGSDGSLRTSIKLPTTDFPDVVQEKLVQGNYISITPDPTNANQSVISTTLSAGDGIAISDDGVVSTTIKLPTTDLPEVVQEKLVQGNYISITPDPTNANQSVISTTLRAGDGIAISDDGIISTTVILPEGGVQEKLTAGTGIKIADSVISTNLKAGSMIQIKPSETDPMTQEISVVGLPANLDGFVVYQPGDGVVFGGDNNDVISANTGDGLKIVDDKIKVNISEDGTGGLKFENGVLKTTAVLPVSGEVQEKLSAGKYINIDENNTITTTLTGSDTINISDEGVISATVALKEYDGTNSITVTDGEDGKTAAIAVKLANENSGLKVDEAGLAVNAGEGLTFDESGALTVTFDPDANTTYEAGNGITISEDKIAISADANGLYLYSFADGKGTWSMVDVVDEGDVIDPTPVAE